jgi:hypothetical protein
MILPKKPYYHKQNLSVYRSTELNKMVKAKFTCSWVQDNGSSKTAHFHAVYSTDGENADFAKATPGGNLSINIDSGVPASNFFEQGKNYYLNFEPAQ